MKAFLKLFILIAAFQLAFTRKHKLQLYDDTRKFIALSTFGFYKGGYLAVNMTEFRPEPFNSVDIYGFSLDKTLTDAMNPYLDNHLENCALKQKSNNSIYFVMDLKTKFVNITCKGTMKDAVLVQDTKELTAPASGVDGAYSFQRSIMPEIPKVAHRCDGRRLPLTIKTNPASTNISLHFVIKIESDSLEGLYSLYFHSCPNFEGKTVNMNLKIEIEEKNLGNFLSAGEMPLPVLYSTMSILFFLSGCFWVFILRSSRHPVFKIHWMMALLVYLKSFSLLFHGINYHFIGFKGEHIATWAILYYITHLLKGSVLFIVILLVGTGWTFIKPILSDKEKKIFMIVLPLQVLTAVADIILEESEEGDAEHHMWRDIFILVDLLCCGAILFPVVWSIRHLQEASETDGKAATNLRKLKLFRHFYIMIVCYIYFTRIIVYVLKVTMPFQYEWLDEMFKEMATYAFYVLSGYKFRPASANPYFQLATEEDDDDDEEMDIVIKTETGLTEGLKKVNRIEMSEKNATAEELESMIDGKESSFQYD